MFRDVMAQVLIVLFFLVLFMALPLKSALLFSGAVLLATLSVQASTMTVARVQVSLSESFKAIVLALFFTVIGSFTIMSFMRGGPTALMLSPFSWGLVVVQYGGFVLGFRMALGLTLGYAALVAAVSTAFISGVIWFITRMSQVAG
jgi:hypothetical protein